jgi:hypothetical protein
MFMQTEYIHTVSFESGLMVTLAPSGASVECWAFPYHRQALVSALKRLSQLPFEVVSRLIWQVNCDTVTFAI